MKDSGFDGGFFSRLKWKLYDLRVKLSGKPKKKQSYTSVKRQETIFLTLLLAIPVIQFCIFYIGVNINSILMAFQEYDGVTGEFKMAGLVQFRKIIEQLGTDGFGLRDEVERSTMQFLLALLVSLPLNVFVAFCVWRNLPFAGFFKVVLFLPSMIPSIVFVLLGRQFLSHGVPEIIEMITGMPSTLDLLDYRDPENLTGFKTVLVFGMWMNFAGGMVVYLGAMSGISDDVVEYGRMENINMLQEFWYIVLPSIFPTITTYIVVTLAGFFTNYGFFYSFFGNKASGTVTTLGHHFFALVAGDGRTPAGMDQYPEAAAGGLLFTLIVTPITLGAKWLLEKYGPSED